MDNLGFNIYREQEGERTRVNRQIIAGSALLVGAGTTLRAGRAYAWWDNARPASDGAQYWLEAIDLRGQRTWHGPASVGHSTDPGGLPLASQRQAALLSKLGEGATPRRLAGPLEQRAARPLLPAVQSVQQALLSTQPAVKLSVREEGWYRVTQPELVALALDSAVDPRFLHLYVDGREVPIHVTGQADRQFGRDDAVEFYGIGLDASWTDMRVYWLLVADRPGHRLEPVSAPGLEPAGTASRTRWSARTEPSISRPYGTMTGRTSLVLW